MVENLSLRWGRVAAVFWLTFEISACATSSPPRSQGLTVLTSGEWGWPEGGQSCANNPHTLRFTEDGKLMLLEFRDAATTLVGERIKTVRYRILEHTDEYLRMQIEGELRTTEEGTPVVWDLIGTSPDSYCWHRTDWPEGACTATNERCR